MSVLTYHRMFAVRRRAAALCAAALGRVRLNGNARPAELCDDIAPRLDVAAACARVPPSRPQFSAPGLGVTGGQQSSRFVSPLCKYTLFTGVRGLSFRPGASKLMCHVVGAGGQTCSGPAH